MKFDTGFYFEDISIIYLSRFDHLSRWCCPMLSSRFGVNVVVCWGRFRTIFRWSRCFQMWRRKIGTWLGLRSRNVAASPRGQGGMEVSRTIHSGANMKNSKKCSFIVKHWVGSLVRFFSLFWVFSWKGSFFNDVMFLWVRQVYWWPLRCLSF